MVLQPGYMSYLVGNPEDTFSHDVAPIVFAGAHLWNIQESSFVYTPSQESQEKEINHDVLFREGQNRLKQV